MAEQNCKHGEDPDLCEACEAALMGDDNLCEHDEDPDLCQECEAALLGDMDEDEDEDEDEEPEPEPKPEPVYQDEPSERPRKRGEPRRPMRSGHCTFPQTADPRLSHERCARNGAGNRAVPSKEFAPCPCKCHLGEEYECGNCGKVIRESIYWDGTGEVTYVHVDREGSATQEDCA